MDVPLSGKWHITGSTSLQNYQRGIILLRGLYQVVRRSGQTEKNQHNNFNLKNSMEVKGVKITERGWAGHFCCADRCAFRRNTLLEKGDVALVVSSVGKMRSFDGTLAYEEIGCGRYYETMVWFATTNNKWKDADIERGEIAAFVPEGYDGKNACDIADDLPANEYHDRIVMLYVDKIARGDTFVSEWDEINDMIANEKEEE